MYNRSCDLQPGLYLQNPTKEFCDPIRLNCAAIGTLDYLINRHACLLDSQE